MMITRGIVGITQAVRAWLDDNHMSGKSLTVILNVAERHEAAALDTALRAEFGYEIRDGRIVAGKPFELYGVKIMIESPLHTP